MASLQETKEQKRPKWPYAEIQEVADALGAERMGVIVYLNREDLGLGVRIVHHMDEDGKKNPGIFVVETKDYTTFEEQPLGKFPFEKREVNKEEGWVKYQGSTDEATCTIKVDKDCTVTRTIRSTALPEPTTVF